MAATDLERLVVQLSADIKKYENAMRRAQGVTNRQLNNIQRQATKTGDSISASFGRVGAAIAAGLAAGASVRALGQLSDAATRIDNALKVAGLSGAELESTYQALAKAAQDNAAPIQSLVDLYSKVSLVQKELNVSNEDLIKFSGNVALALRVAGSDAQSASGALLQLSQALGGGTVRAEEFNSILEGAPTIARAAALGLKEAGGSVAELRKLVIDGELSSEAFFRAFEAGSVVLERQASTTTLTFGQALTNLNNALVNAAREFNSATGAGQNFANGLDRVAQSINNIDFDTFIGRIREARDELASFFNAAGDAEIFQRLNELLGVTNAEGVPINVDKTEAEAKIAELENEVETLQTLIELNTNLGLDVSGAIENLAAVRGELAALRAEAANMPETMGPTRVVPGVGLVQTPDTGGGTNGSMGGSSIRGGARRVPTVNQVSVEDFAPPVSSGGGGGRAKKGGGGGQSAYQREIEQIRERTAALQAETAALAGLNPLQNDYGFALEKARTTQELLTAAQQSGLAITPQLKATIDQLATGYANASVEAQKLSDSQESMRQAAEDFRNTSKDVVSGFISDLRSGKSAAEALQGALDKVLDKVIDIALNSAFGIGGGGGAGFFGSILKIFGFAKGGYTGNGGKYQPAGVVHKGEYVFDKQSVQKAGGPAALDAMRRGLKGYATGGYVGSAPTLPSMRKASGQQQVAVTVGVSADQNGNLMPFVQSVAQREVSTAAPKIVQAANAQAPMAVSKYQASKGGAEWRQ